MRSEKGKGKTMTMTRGTAALQLAAAALAAPFLGVAPASAQDGLREEQHPSSVGMVLIDDGGWRYPTVEEAFGFLAMDRDEIERLSAGTPAWYISQSWPMAAILRQAGKERPAAALDAIAGRLTSIILNEDNMDGWKSSAGQQAVYALAAAARPAEDGRAGVPYRKAFDILVSLYENGYVHLGNIFRTGGERGRTYVRRLFETSEPPALCSSGGGWVSSSMTDTLPPPCKRGQKDVPWCEAGDLLYKDILRAANKRTWPTGIRISNSTVPDPMPKGLPEHVADWHRRCMKF